MTNDAAERLLTMIAYDVDPEEYLPGDWMKRHRDALDEALAAERRATVERVKANLDQVAAMAAGDVEALGRKFSRGHWDNDYADYLAGYATALMDMARRKKPIDAEADR